MAFVDNFLLPLIQAFITFLILGFILLGVFFALGKARTNKLYLWFKYKVLRRPYNPHIVEWCMDMIERQTPEEELMREFFLTNRFNPSQYNDAIYIYKKVEKVVENRVLKGGYKESWHQS